MSQNDYYKTLGVSRDASADDLRKAYRKLARKYHPDMNPDDPAAVENFKQVQEAFEVLGDTEKRAQYDRYGTAFPGGGPGGAAGPWQTGGTGGFPDLQDILGGEIDLSGLFGGGMPFGRGRGPAGPRPMPGADQRAEINIPFQVAVEGGGHEIQVQRDGTPDRLEVKIPSGVQDGSVIRLAGEGAPGGNGGPAGDLLVTIRVAPHPFFSRERNNLLLEVPLSVDEAVIGAKVEVPTLADGKVVLTIPPGSSSGTKLRLRGKGVQDLKTGKRGDQIVILKIAVPQSVSRRASEALRTYAAETDHDPRAGPVAVNRRDSFPCLPQRE